MCKQNPECPFCTPIADDACFAESENFRAIYNIAPILPGHCLVVPKNHIESFLEIPDSQMVEMLAFSRKIIKVLNQAFKTNSYNWIIQDGEDAGQTIEHFHLHIIPRKEKDLPEPGDWYPILQHKQDEMIDSLLRAKYSKKELKDIVAKLKSLF
jgi:bis(5'-adenosyl)-triphosphatase